MNPANVPADRPIGYWLKHLDRLLERRFDEVLAGQSLARRHWQVLTTVKRTTAQEPAVRRQTLVDALQPFWGEGEVSLDEVLADLARRGWITETTEPAVTLYSLTSTGTAAHATIAGEVDEVRALLCEGMSEQEYVDTVGVLARMARNLETAGVPSSRS